jgi:hypothetical protein
MDGNGAGMGTDAVMARVGEAIGAGLAGDLGAARQVLGQLWREVGPDGDPFHRCAIAHAMADVQDEVLDELAWDLRALDAGRLLTDDRLERAGVAGPARGFLPSLHLNLADVYRRLGEDEAARRHIALGRSARDALAEDGYGQMVLGALDRVEAELDARSR